MRLSKVPKMTQYLLLALVMISTGFLVSCSDEPEKVDVPRPVAWTTVDYADKHFATKIAGVLVAAEQAPLAFDLPGMIETVSVTVGDAFAKGDILATLDPNTFNLQVSQREAELAEAQTALALADQEHQRSLQLIPIDAISQSRFDVTEAELDSARSRLRSAKVRLDLAQSDLSDTQIIAPYSGQLTERLIEPAQRVQPGQTVLQIQSDSQRFEVDFSVSEQVVSQMALGDRYEVYLPALATQIAAVITEIGVDSGTSNAYPVTLKATKMIADARAGMTAEIALATAKEELPITIPVTAFATDTTGARYSLVLNPVSATNNESIANTKAPDLWQVTRRNIELGAVDQQYAIVHTGLEFGQPIVSQGLTLLNEGDIVTRLNEGARQFAE